MPGEYLSDNQKGDYYFISYLEQYSLFLNLRYQFILLSVYVRGFAYENKSHLGKWFVFPVTL